MCDFIGPRLFCLYGSLGLPWWLRWESICLQCGRPGFNPWVRKISWRRKWQPTPVLLPAKSHGWRSLVGYSPWGQKESDMTEQLHFHFPHKSHISLLPWDKGECISIFFDLKFLFWFWKKWKHFHESQSYRGRCAVSPVLGGEVSPGS